MPAVLGLIVGLAIAILIFQPVAPQTGGVVINDTAVPPVPTLVSGNVGMGATLYAQHCASCHGPNLEGAANWKQPLADGSLPAPPHDSAGHTWHHTDGLLLNVTLNGGDPAFNSKMPAFREKLNEDEAGAILEFIKSKWGKDEREFQWWITYNNR